MSLVILFWGEVGNFRSPRVVPREQVRSPKFESRRGKLLRDGCACAARVKLGMRNVRRVHLTDIWSWYRVELRVGDHVGRSEELVSRCVECDLAEPESLASLGGSAPGVVDRILSTLMSGLPLIPTLMSLVIAPKGQYRPSAFWMTLHPLWPYVLPSWLTSMILGPTNMLSTMRHLTMRNSGLILVGSIWILFRKPWNSLPNGESTYPIHSL